MTAKGKRELTEFLRSNKREVNAAVKDMETHSKEFDRKLKKILSVL